MSRLLQHHLSHSPIEPDEAGLPFANPSSDLRFSSFVSLWPLSDRSYEATLFRLGHALFDEIDLKLADSITIDIRRRVEIIRRKAALSAWLEKTVAPTVEAELRQHSIAGSPAVAFTLLTGNQVEKACERAIDGGNIKLATLISQASGDAVFKDDLRSQLQIWSEQRIDAHIDESVRKIYALLAGIVDVVPGSKGTGIERCEDIDLAKGLDWKRTFGLHLWFAEPQDASIADVYQSYTRRWKESPHRVTPPNPPHAKRATNVPPDALSSLIRLYAEPACSLSQILIPTSFGPSPTDYSLPWHLYILLSRCMRIRDLADRGEPDVDSDTQDGGDDNTRVEGHSPSADLLASGYAFQLEQLGMIQEAVFVLLHIEGSAGCAWILFFGYVACLVLIPPSGGKKRSKICCFALQLDWTSG
jgi:nuclear pore complex protein Nup98-Nup96